MKITYIGHSCFRIEKDGYSVVIDPYADDSVPGLANVREQANMVLTSHDHFDHNAVDTVEIVDASNAENGSADAGRCTSDIADSTAADDVCPFTITKIESYHDECHGEKRGMNTIHILDDGTNRVAHFGDIGCDIMIDMPEDDRAKLMNLDAAMIPVGGTYTIDGPEAVALMEAIESKIVIPMHFKSDKHGFGLPDIATRRKFTANLASVIEHRKSWIETEDEPYAQVNVLIPQNCR